jgi:hypothetical protein
MTTVIIMAGETRRNMAVGTTGMDMAVDMTDVTVINAPIVQY